MTDTDLQLLSKIAIGRPLAPGWNPELIESQQVEVSIGLRRRFNAETIIRPMHPEKGWSASITWKDRVFESGVFPTRQQAAIEVMIQAVRAIDQSHRR